MITNQNEINVKITKNIKKLQTIILYINEQIIIFIAHINEQIIFFHQKFDVLIENFFFRKSNFIILFQSR